MYKWITEGVREGTEVPIQYSDCRSCCHGNVHLYAACTSHRPQPAFRADG